MVCEGNVFRAADPIEYESADPWHMSVLPTQKKSNKVE